MSDRISIQPRSDKRGYTVSVHGGGAWSVVNLSLLPHHNEVPEVAALSDMIGNAYDGMGGRFEAMPIPEFDRILRDHSFRGVICEVLEAEGIVIDDGVRDIIDHALTCPI